MFRQTKYPRTAAGEFVTTNSFKISCAVVEGVRQHVDLGVLPRNQLAIEPNFISFDRHCASLILPGLFRILVYCMCLNSTHQLGQKKGHPGFSAVAVNG